MEGRELRRCYTQVDFATIKNYKNHHFQNSPHQIRLKHNSNVSVKPKFPTIEIYRPPGQRGDPGSDGIPTKQLNVHAKEFVMNSSTALQTSKSTGNMMIYESKTEKHEQNNNSLVSSLKQSNIKNVSLKHVRWEDKNGRGLQRSKSMISKSSSPNTDDLVITPLGSLTSDGYANIKHAIHGTSKLSCEQVMSIVYILVDRAQEGRNYSNPIASVCHKIIDRDTSTLFFESLVNYCQFTLNKLRDTAHKRYNGIMGFICELYIMMKVSSKDTKWEMLCPLQRLLKLLIKCGHEILQDPSLHEKPDQVESLFLTVTTVGKDLEKEVPQLMDGLVAALRDSFLCNKKLNDACKHTILQMIEIRACGWQLPAFTLMYYNSSSQTNRIINPV